MSFRSVFVAVLVSTAIIAAALILNARRPAIETAQPTAGLVKASGKCAECHRNETKAMVVEYEQSLHAVKGVNCLDCHRALSGQESMEHRGFTLAKKPTAKNCAQCHRTEYEQFLRSRHAAPAYAAVVGDTVFTPEQIAHAEKYHPGAVKREANALVGLEGNAAAVKGCLSCHAVGKPNADGSIGSCTQCHSRHLASVRLARLPETCGQCHMGPDHSQIEIYKESKHGVIFDSLRDRMNLDARPDELTADDMPVPTCATCHMSGLGGQKNDPRHLGAAIVLALRGELQAAAQPPGGPRQHAGRVQHLPRREQHRTVLRRGRLRRGLDERKDRPRPRHRRQPAPRRPADPAAVR